eukprot:3747478-Amphidinium_carterae.1
MFGTLKYASTTGSPTCLEGLLSICGLSGLLLSPYYTPTVDTPFEVCFLLEGQYSPIVSLLQ